MLFLHGGSAAWVVYDQVAVVRLFTHCQKYTRHLLTSQEEGTKLRTMKRHSHPAHRARGTLSQAAFEAAERAESDARQQAADDRFPEREREARERSDRWLKDLEG